MSLRTMILVVAIGAASACGRPADEPSPPPTPPAAAVQALTVVEDASKVCMVNNTYMGQAQDPVVVEGKTYFGCCPACRQRLTDDASLRVARDPVTGEVVDKSRAVMARDDRNGILYFASAQNVRRYTPPR